MAAQHLLSTLPIFEDFLQDTIPAFLNQRPELNCPAFLKIRAQAMAQVLPIGTHLILIQKRAKSRMQAS